MTDSPRTQLRGSARRDQLLDGLVRIFVAEGFLHFSLEALAVRLQCSKSTLYAVAASKEQLITAVVRTFFRTATDAVDRRTAQVADPVERIGVYLEAISDALAPATSRFIADLDAFEPAREIYAHNTRIAVERVQDLVRDATDAASSPAPAFLGAVAGIVMAAIQRGEMGRMTRIGDAAAYRLLADLIVAGVESGPGDSDVHTPDDRRK